MTSDTTTDAARHAQDRWEEEGRRIAPSLDSVAAVVVIGEDPDAAAAVALGVGRVQSRRRRVAIADLVGEVAPLQSLVSGDDPHGIVDSFLYGVSLNRIARPIDDSKNLFVLPSGSEPIVAEEIFRNERWGRLATGFRDVGALLILVAPVATAGVEALVARVDGVVLAGRGTPTPAGATVLALAEPPSLDLHDAERETAELPVPTLAAAEASAPVAGEPPASIEPTAPIEPAAIEPRLVAEPIAIEPPDVTTAAPFVATAGSAPASEPAVPTDRPAARWLRRIAEAPPTLVNVEAVVPSAKRPPDAADPEPEWMPPRRRRWPYALAAGIVVTLAASALLSRGGGTRSEAGRRATPTRPATVASDSLGAAAPASGVAGARPGDTGTTTPVGATSPTSAPSPGAPSPASAAALVSNPADSATAAAYSVQIVAANTVEGARAKLRDVALGLPAAVISPMSLGADSTRWYRLTVGAFADRQAAIAYLVQVRDRRKLDLEAENVVRLPFALLLQSRVPRSVAKARVEGFVSRGLPAYALMQRDGTARVYAGAFETPEQAALLADQLRTAGIEPVVAYRTGRGF